MMLTTVTGAGIVITPDALEEVLRRKYGSLHVGRRSPAARGRVNISILAGTFQPIVTLGDSMTNLAIQGSWEEAAEIAAVVRAAVPTDGPGLVLLADDGSGFADVPPGATPESVAAGRKDISHFPGYTEN